MVELQNKEIIVKRVCCVSMNTPNRERFILRLLLTLQGREALTWTWLTVRNAVWLPAFRSWLRKLVTNQHIPEPPDDKMRTIGSLVLSRGADPNGTDPLDWALEYVLACMRQFTINSQWYSSRRPVDR